MVADVFDDAPVVIGTVQSIEQSGSATCPDRISSRAAGPYTASARSPSSIRSGMVSAQKTSKYFSVRCFRWRRTGRCVKNVDPRGTDRLDHVAIHHGVQLFRIRNRRNASGSERKASSGAAAGPSGGGWSHHRPMNPISPT